MTMAQIFVAFSEIWTLPRAIKKNYQDGERNQVFKETNICQANLILGFLHQCNAMVSSSLLSLNFVLIALQKQQNQDWTFYAPIS